MTDPLCDPLRAIFTNEVIARLKSAPQTESREYRVAAITRDQLVGGHVPRLGAQRAAWTLYLDAALECGLFADPHGKDLRTRLTQVDDGQFRAAMAECQAAWYLSEKLGLGVTARPPGKGASELELLVKLTDGDMHVEVKSPLRVGIPDGVVRTVDDTDILDRCLADASKQLRKETRNLVMLVGRVTLGVGHRRFFMKAFYAAEKLVVDREADDARVDFDYTGRFLKVWPREDGPRHTRVGGVLFVEENIRSSVEDGVTVYRADNDALMMHNPNALRPLPEVLWGGCPQMVLRGDSMEWSDGFPVGGPTPA